MHETHGMKGSVPMVPQGPSTTRKRSFSISRGEMGQFETKPRGKVIPVSISRLEIETKQGHFMARSMSLCVFP